MSEGRLTYAKAIAVERMKGVDTDPLGIRIRDMVQEFEEFQSKAKDRIYVAVRTRQAIVKKGFKKVVEEAVKARPSVGFQTMVTNGLARLTYEWIYLEFFPAVFKNGAMAEHARTRLERHGVSQLPGDPSPLRKRPPKAKLELQPIPAGAQAILRANKEATAERGAARMEKVAEKRPRGKKLTVAEAEAKQVKKTRKLAETVHELHPPAAKAKAKGKGKKALADAVA